MDGWMETVVTNCMPYLAPAPAGTLVNLRCSVMQRIMSNILLVLMIKELCVIFFRMSKISLM